MCPITINKALLLQEGILRFELSWTAVTSNTILRYTILRIGNINLEVRALANKTGVNKRFGIHSAYQKTKWCLRGRSRPYQRKNRSHGKIHLLARKFRQSLRGGRRRRNHRFGGNAALPNNQPKPLRVNCHHGLL